jgi:hypothetical protein
MQGIFILSRISVFVLLLLSAVGSGSLGVNTTHKCQAYVSTAQIAEGLAITSVRHVFLVFT